MENIIFLYILKNLGMSETTKQKVKDKGPQIYLAEQIIADDELSKLKKIVFQFSAHRKMLGSSSSILREKLILLTALYMKYGYNNDAKDQAAKILKIERSAVNSMNLELRNVNILVKDAMNTRINHLHPDLEKLREYINGNGEDPLYFLVKITNE